MKLLLDANISWRITKLIENDFPGCFHSKDIPVNQPAKDLEIWDYARKNSFTILTMMMILKNYYFLKEFLKK